MKYRQLKQSKHCRFCGIQYYAHKPTNQDGFCSMAHHQARYRAYKTYVTHKHADPAAKAAPTQQHK